MTDTGETVRVDTLVVGSGPVGSLVARRHVEAGRNVLVVEAGPKYSERPGVHLKNAHVYQRNIDLFASIIRGHLHLVSVPPEPQAGDHAGPGPFAFDAQQFRGFVINNQNPEQDPTRNLDAAAVTYGVGGMATHWTCATPRQHPTVERHSSCLTRTGTACTRKPKQLCNTSHDAFAHAIRHQLVLDALRDEYTELKEPYQVQHLPLAVERRTGQPGARPLDRHRPRARSARRWRARRPV